MRKCNYLCVISFLMTLSSPVLLSQERGHLSAVKGMNIALRTNPNNEDFAKIRSWGANAIRLVLFFNPDSKRDDGLITSYSPLKINEGGMVKLDHIIDLAGKNNLSVILDMHSWPRKYNGEFWNDISYWDDYIQLWDVISQRYKGNSTVLAYDLMNEPNLLLSLPNKPEASKMMRDGSWSYDTISEGSSRDYFTLMQRVIDVVRKVDREKILIIEGVGFFGHPINFTWMRPLKGNNLVYSFHMYEPKPFVNLGKKSELGARLSLLRYPSARYNKKSLTEFMRPVINFSKRYNVEIFVGEFGVSYFTEDKGGDVWIRDLTRIFEELGWGWAYWSYNVKFRSPENVGGRVQPDNKRMKALKEGFE
jgi:endoglucanase